MKIFLIAVAALSVAACNTGGETESAAPTASAPAVEPAAAAPTAGALVNSAMEKAVDPNVQGCLSKVQAKAFKEALPLCLKAANVEPDNPQVQAALDTARENAAVDVVKTEDAKKQLDSMKDAAKGMKLP